MNRKDQLPVILSGIFFIIMLFNVFTVTKLPIRDLAFTTMEWMLYISFFVIGYAIQKQSHWDKRLTPFYSGFILLSVMYIIIHIVNGNYYDNNGLTEMLLILTFIFAVVHVKWDHPKQIILFAQISVALIFLILIQWILLDYPMSRFQSYIRNPNILGVFMSCLLFFPLIAFSRSYKWNKLIFLLGIIAGSVIIYVSTARAVILLLLTVVGARIVLYLSKKVFSYLFHVIVIFNILFLAFYTLLAKSSYFDSLNNWSIETFGKNFFSGRQNIWEPVMEFGLKQPIFGHKVGIMPVNYMEGSHYVHVHNQYLQIFLESGLVGLVCFVFFLYGIWKVYQKGLHSNIVRWSACFFLGILVYQSVEVSLFFNMEPIGLMHWFIIAIGMSAVLFYKPEAKEMHGQTL